MINGLFKGAQEQQRIGQPDLVSKTLASVQCLWGFGIILWDYKKETPIRRNLKCTRIPYSKFANSTNTFRNST